jgi:diguanylate cyclase (GGDEF)-like protein
MIFFFLSSINKVSDIYMDKTRETILDLKKDFLKDTVNNLISEMDSEIETKADYMDKLVANTAVILNLQTPKINLGFQEFFLNFFRKDVDYDFWTVLLWDKKAKKAVYDSDQLSGTTWEATLENIQTALSSYRVISQENTIAVYGISHSYIYELVKSEMANSIRTLRFNDDSYIWVNEVLNYEGGENYAIRRVHPNLPETEGMYLSTDMPDIRGNYPYLTELGGINQYGELFFSYYFKELESDEISEKLAYAKLYKKFDWIIAMGIYQKDIQAVVDQTNRESKALVSRLTLILAVIFVIILFMSYILIILIEKLYYRHSKKLLETEINQDTLTKAGSRRGGTKDLIHAFKEFKENGSNAGIMMFDIDNFKCINDTHGHAVGDRVLIEIVKAIYGMIRSSDKLIRWGGDEFILIIYGLQESNALGFANKILAVTSSLNISAEEAVISPTLSIGFSYFKEEDMDSSEVLKRVDQALYKSKESGRNQVNLVL